MGVGAQAAAASVADDLTSRGAMAWGDWSDDWWGEWSDDWQERLDAWWLALPAATSQSLQNCAAFLGGVLVESFDAWARRLGATPASAPPPAAKDQASECEQVVDGVSESLPHFPEPPEDVGGGLLQLRRERWRLHLPALPRLLPEKLISGRPLQWLERSAHQMAQETAPPRHWSAWAFSLGFAIPTGLCCVGFAMARVAARARYAIGRLVLRDGRRVAADSRVAVAK